MATRLFGNCDDFDSFVGWLVDNFEKTLRPIYFNCTNPEMVECLSRLIQKTAQRGSTERGIALYQLFVESLLGCLDHWRAAPELVAILHDYLQCDPAHVELARQRNWLSSFLVFVRTVFEQKKYAFKESVDLSRLFDSMACLIDI
jgi:hypothetical protein